MNKNVRKWWRDEAIGQLLHILRPFQVAALNVDDVAYDGSRLFLRVLKNRGSIEQHNFVLVSSRAQGALEAFLKKGRPLYKGGSEALFLNRYGCRLSTRSIHKQHRRTRQLIDREIVEIGEPCGKDGLAWFNKWSRANVVYFTQRRDGVVKIGYSANLFVRLAALEGGNGQLKMLGLIEGDKHLEGKIRGRFRHLCVAGTEWFRPDLELLVFIQKVVEEGCDGLPF